MQRRVRCWARYLRAKAPRDIYPGETCSDAGVMVYDVPYTFFLFPAQVAWMRCPVPNIFETHFEVSANVAVDADVWGYIGPDCANLTEIQSGFLALPVTWFVYDQNGMAWCRIENSTVPALVTCILKLP